MAEYASLFEFDVNHQIAKKGVIIIVPGQVSEPKWTMEDSLMQCQIPSPLRRLGWMLQPQSGVRHVVLQSFAGMRGTAEMMVRAGLGAWTAQTTYGDRLVDLVPRKTVFR